MILSGTVTKHGRFVPRFPAALYFQASQLLHQLKENTGTTILIIGKKFFLKTLAISIISFVLLYMVIKNG